MRFRDEDGQALVLALAFLMFFGLIIGAMLDLADASVQTTSGLRTQRTTAYTADGAMDAAIQAGRYDTHIGAYGMTPCMDTGGGAFTYSASGTTVTVACTVSPSGDPLQPDRSVTFTVTDSGNNKLIVASVVYHDGIGGGSTPVPVDVVSWTYCAHDPGTC